MKEYDEKETKRILESYDRYKLGDTIILYLRGDLISGQRTIRISDKKLRLKGKIIRKEIIPDNTHVFTHTNVGLLIQVLDMGGYKEARIFGKNVRLNDTAEVTLKHLEYALLVDGEEEFAIDFDQIFSEYFVENSPQFPGNFMVYIQENMNYPEEAREKKIRGSVFVSFVVERDGSLSNIKIVIGIGRGCDEEAVRIIENMPKWNPGKHRGRVVRVELRRSIRFVLPE